MTPSAAWFSGLTQFVQNRRLTQPLPQEASSVAADAAERSIIAASLAMSLAECHEVRSARRSLRLGDADAAVVITSSPVGIRAAEEIVTSTPVLAALVGDRVIAVTEAEYRSWCMLSPDDRFIHHVNVWNWIKTRVPRQRNAEFASYPLGENDAYWLHREGRAGAATLDRRACHLWKWNGRHATLLKPFVTERRVGPLGPAAADA